MFVLYAFFVRTITLKKKILIKNVNFKNNSARKIRLEVLKTKLYTKI